MQLVVENGRQVLSIGFDAEATAEILHQEYLGTLAKARELQLTAERNAEISQILASLPYSWRERDPGKRVANYSFLDREGHYVVVVRELIPDGVEQFSGSREEWYKRESGKRYYESHDMIPPYEGIVGFDEVSRAACPDCGTEQPLIEEYEQIYDGPDGDTWRKRQLVICCEKVQVLSSESSGMRF